LLFHKVKRSLQLVRKWGEKIVLFIIPWHFKLNVDIPMAVVYKEETALTLLHLSKVNNGFTWNSEGRVVPAIGKAH
jgi:hypothetical protein